MLYDLDKMSAALWPLACLNAPFGARCFMTGEKLVTIGTTTMPVLMHRLALGAL